MSSPAWVRHTKRHLARFRELHGHPINAICQTLVGRRFGAIIMGGKFKWGFSPYISDEERREKGYNPLLSLESFDQSISLLPVVSNLDLPWIHRQILQKSSSMGSIHVVLHFFVIFMPFFIVFLGFAGGFLF